MFYGLLQDPCGLHRAFTYDVGVGIPGPFRTGILAGTKL
jgi:hypothetical protein